MLFTKQLIILAKYLRNMALHIRLSIGCSSVITPKIMK